MGLDNGFTRRVCAVLHADVSGYSTLVGEDDERTARAVEALQSMVEEIVSEHQGTAESRAGDAVLATFQSVVAAVDAAITIQRRIAAATFAGQRLQTRIGVCLGDVLLRQGATVGAAVGDSVNIAVRLEALAQPGTICISQSVYRQVRKKFDEKFVDLGVHRLKNIADPVHAYLIVPDAPAPGGRRLPWRTALLGGGAALAVGGLVVLATGHFRSGLYPHADVASLPSNGGAHVTTERSTPIALGVMVFKGMADDTQYHWRREAIRDGLNSQLNQLSGVKVYSKEFIDFLITRKGLTEIEAAAQLGIREMLSGSVVEQGGTVRIETHIVNVSSGVLEASFTTTGTDQDFSTLQSKVALGVIARLNLPATADEKRALALEKSNVEALRMLLEAEGAASVAPPSAITPASPESALPRWMAQWPQLVPAAYADAAADEAAVKHTLESYRHATESKQIGAIAALYTEFPAEQQAAQMKYFENIRELHVTLDHIDVVVVGNEAVVSYTRTDDFIDARTGRPMHVAVRLTKTLRNDNGSWKLSAQ
jgi:adenylate cyclase